MLKRKNMGYLAPAAMLALAGMAAFVPPAPTAHAASSIGTLIAQAVHNTDTVKTLVHHDQWTISGPSGSVKVLAHGAEDEVRNREQDYESVHVTQRAANGKVNTLAYTVDLIFMNGSTYYRTSAVPTQWKTQKGMTFSDPYTQGWKRGRTTVTPIKGLVFKDMGTSGGQTHVRASVSAKANTETVDLWITTGSKPYVVRQDVTFHVTAQGKTGVEVLHVAFGPFNSVLNIQPPNQATA